MAENKGPLTINHEGETYARVENLWVNTSTFLKPPTEIAAILDQKAGFYQKGDSPASTQRGITVKHRRRQRETLNDLPPEFQLSDEFYQAFLQIEHGRRCTFITGKAGSGKSTFLRYLRIETGKNMAVVAPTGVAALNVHGETIHSFFKFPVKPIASTDIYAVEDKALYRALETLVIDEISMVRADMIDGIDQFLRINRKKRDLPFGGVQLVMIGDLFQLPPIIATDAERQLLHDTYPSPYFFYAKGFEDAGMDMIEMRRIYRQTDDTFLHILNGIRNRSINEDTLRLLNSRCEPEFEPSDREPYVTLATTNRRVGLINSHMMKHLPGKSRIYEGQLSGAFENVGKQSLPTAVNLKLKENAQVMFVKNDYDHRWVNGTMGCIRRLDDDEIDIEITHGGDQFLVTVEPETWEMTHYQYDSETKTIETEIIGEFTQFPIVPAYAMTIHKSQGQTFDRVIIDFTDPPFAFGQVYVALSRCRTLDGIVLRRPLNPRDIKVDQAIINFTKYHQMLNKPS